MYNEYLLICTKAGTSGSENTLDIDETEIIPDGTCAWSVLYNGIAEFITL